MVGDRNSGIMGEENYSFPVVRVILETSGVRKRKLPRFRGPRRANRRRHWWQHTSTMLCAYTGQEVGRIARG